MHYRGGSELHHLSCCNSTVTPKRGRMIAPIDDCALSALSQTHSMQGTAALGRQAEDRQDALVQATLETAAMANGQQSRPAALPNAAPTVIPSDTLSALPPPTGRSISHLGHDCRSGQALWAHRRTMETHATNADSLATGPVNVISHQLSLSLMEFCVQ